MEPEPRWGLLTLEEAASGSAHEFGVEGLPVYGFEVSAATAAGAEIVSGEDYVVDAGLGMICFLRDLRDVQVLWQQAPAVAQTIDRDTAAALLGTDHLAVQFEQERAAVRARRAGLTLMGSAAMHRRVVWSLDTQAAP